MPDLPRQPALLKLQLFFNTLNIYLTSADEQHGRDAVVLCSSIATLRTENAC